KSAVSMESLAVFRSSPPRRYHKWVRNLFWGGKIARMPSTLIATTVCACRQPKLLWFDADEGNLRAAEKTNRQDRSSNPAAYIHLGAALFVPAFQKMPRAPGQPERLREWQPHLSSMGMTCKAKVGAARHVAEIAG